MARDRYPSIAVAPQARVLLLVLLAHLTFMATPFHRAMLEGGQDHPLALSAGGNGLHREHVTPGDRAHADCAIQWVTSPQVSLSVGLMAAPILGWMSDGLASEQITRPLARANGPPHGDRQALLQVFRL